MAVAVVPKLASLIVFYYRLDRSRYRNRFLLRELDRHADAVRVGHAAPDLPCLANESPTELPRDKNDAYFVFCLATRRWKKKQRRTRAAQQRDYRRAAHLKEDPGCHLQIWRSEIGYGAPIINASEPTHASSTRVTAASISR